MDDILILSYQHSQVANLWVNYLNSCFEQICTQRGRTPFRVMCVGLDEICGSMCLALEERLVRVRVQLLVMCPQFLQRLAEQPLPGPALARLLQPDRVIAMLLGVPEDSVTEEQQTALGSYAQWRRVPVRDKDSTFVGEFLNEVMAVLARVASEQHAARQERAGFSVIPKKVKQGHNKVVVLLNEPLDAEDKVKISVNKNGEIIEVNTAKRRNPYTIVFAMPDTCLEISMLVSVRVEKNGELLGSRQVKCESRMRELDQLLRATDNPLDFMCQTLGFSMGDREQLDTFLVTAFQRNLPPNFQLFQPASRPNQLEPGTPHSKRHPASSEEYPTLLHFAARFGLDKLAWQLLECPGGEAACETRNGSNLTPADMAEAAGHSKLADNLKGHMAMNEMSNIYCYLKMAVTGSSQSPLQSGAPHGFGAPKSPSLASTCEPEQVDYHLPRPISETYQVPPLARPVRPLPTPETADVDETGGYLQMLPGSGSSLRRSPQPADKNKVEGSKDGSTTPSINVVRTSDEYPLPPPRPTDTFTPSTRKFSRETAANGTQDELLEIINDFKNNVFTISEVEKLVEHWKNRNDVQQSYKDKQEQLNAMRAQYEMIQEKMKADMKHATPFDRIRKFFGLGKSKEGKVVAAENDGGQTCNTLGVADRTSDLSQRPASSLSICSTSSSERMSTMSACSGISLGDSGTHSDPEDRKNSQILPPLREPPPIIEEAEMFSRSPSQTMSSYVVPPPPRPVHEARNKPSRLNMNLPLRDTAAPYDRPPLPVPRPGLQDMEEEDVDYVQNELHTEGGIVGSADSGNHYDMDIRKSGRGEKNDYVIPPLPRPLRESRGKLHTKLSKDFIVDRPPPPLPRPAFTHEEPEEEDDSYIGFGDQGSLPSAEPPVDYRAVQEQESSEQLPSYMNLSPPPVPRRIDPPPRLPPRKD